MLFNKTYTLNAGNTGHSKKEIEVTICDGRLLLQLSQLNMIVSGERHAFIMYTYFRTATAFVYM